MQRKFHGYKDKDIVSAHFMKKQQKMEYCYTSFTWQIEGKLMGLLWKSALQSPVQSTKN